MIADYIYAVETKRGFDRRSTAQMGIERNFEETESAIVGQPLEYLATFPSFRI
jgi:hypothetical protein